MGIRTIYEKYPTHEACLDHLEQIRWEGNPQCPYCKCHIHTKMKEPHRYHCRCCNNSYSVMVGTIFHNTKLKLPIWFLAIALMLDAKKSMSSRQMARHLEVNKDTAWRIMMKIRDAMYNDSSLLSGIVEADETYVGGKNKFRHKNKKVKNSQGRSYKDKLVVLGVVERGGKVKAKRYPNSTSESIKSFITENVEKGSTLITDEWKAYNVLNDAYTHKVINHNLGIYGIGDTYTNTIEGFWTLVKRSITGQFHRVSKTYINKYLDECSYKYNTRKSKSVLNDSLKRSVTIDDVNPEYRRKSALLERWNIKMDIGLEHDERMREMNSWESPNKLTNTA